ncbi:MAG: cadmium-translocating P-type ATPase [Thermicanus sp.]|nr:cadmium-translocating P-type ATPase [Thermicanus sp.]
MVEKNGPHCPEKKGGLLREKPLPKLLYHGEMIAALLSGALILIAFLLERVGISPLDHLIYLIAFLCGGFVKGREGILSLVQEKKLDVNLLMILAAIGAAVIGYWMEGAVLIFIFAVSGALETYTLAKSRKDLTSLMSLAPEVATLYMNGEERTVRIESLKLGDTILVRPGERVPIDGKIVKGNTSIDQSSITGESVPVERSVGDEVFGGTLNGEGAILLEVTARSESTLFSRIIQLVKEAENEMPPSQRFIERFESFYVYSVLGITLFLLFLPPYLFGWSWNESLYKAMVFMVVASPCALVASVTPAMLSAISNGARKGILFKGGAHLENLSATKVVAFDKTGTITHGKPEITDLIPADGITEMELLRLTASVETLSEHPIAKAVVAKAQELHLPLELPKELKAVTGRGVEAIFGDEVWRVGNRKFIEPEEGNVWLPALERLELEGKTVILLEISGKVMGVVALRDTLRPEAEESIERLKKLGVKVAMLTGDHRTTAESIAKEAGVDLVYAELLPQNKAEIIKDLKKRYGHVTMVGDGVNDAPALATANVGIAMGAVGSDVALETADIVLMNDQLSRIPYAIKLGKRAGRILKENIFFSISVILLLISANFGADLPLPLGVIGHEGSTILVILNGLRLLRG